MRLGADGHFATVDQGSGDHVADSARALLLTPPGWRELRPDVGVPDPRFSMRPELGDIERQIAEHIPDAEAALEVEPSPVAAALGEFGINVEITGRGDD